MIPRPLLMLLLVMLTGWAVFFTVGALARLPRRFGPVELPDVGREAAQRLTTDVLWSAMDPRFGFPTGFFAVDPAASEPGRLVAQEQTFSQSDMKALLLSSVQAPIEWGKRNNSAAGPIFGVVLGVVLVPVMVWAAVCEFGMRRILRSQITADLTDLGDRFGTQVTFTARGPSAWLAIRGFLGAFDTPRLPGKVIRKAARNRKRDKGQ